MGPKPKVLQVPQVPTEGVYVQWRARNFAHIGHFTDLILLK
jgi:hypothetical protein